MRDRKSYIQGRIERTITNNRCFQTVPYTKIFGEKNALRQWLLFSNRRVISNYNTESDKTSLFTYLSTFYKEIYQFIIEDQIERAFILTYLKMEDLERRVRPFPMQVQVSKP